MRLFCFLVFALFIISCHSEESGENTRSISHLQWNILAPMWVDRPGRKAMGDFWDMNLLNDDIRLELIVDRIAETDADIVTLQEVQIDVYEKLRKRLPRCYRAVAFAPNENNYWASYLVNGTSYIQNGVATLYKWQKFSLVAHNSFLTSPDGNVALAAVLRPKSTSYFMGTMEKRGNPIVIINCHLETGYKQEEMKSRVSQTIVMMNEAERISTGIKTRFPTSNSIVIITGDMNTGNHFPAFKSFIDNGYLNNLLESGNDKDTFFYPVPFPVPGVGIRTGVPIDHTFIKEEDTKNGLIELSSVEMPDITSDDLKEENYIENVIHILANNLLRYNVRGDKYNIIKFLLNSASFANLYELSKDESKYDTNVNRVLRMGSDHLPILNTFKMKL